MNYVESQRAKTQLTVRNRILFSLNNQHVRYSNSSSNSSKDNCSTYIPAMLSQLFIAEVANHWQVSAMAPATIADYSRYL